jgi:hypothetical protein
VKTEGDGAPLIFFDSSQVELEASETRDVLVKIVVPKLAEHGNYEGEIVLASGEKSVKIAATVRVLSPEGKLLDVKIQPLSPTVKPGDILRLQTDLLNLGKTKRVDVQFDLQLLDVSTGEIMARNEEAFAVETTISAIKEFKIPETVPTGKYMIKATAYYSNVEQSMQASSIAYITVQYAFLDRELFGLSFKIYLLAILIIAILVGAFFYMRWLEYKKKRFKSKVEINKLPQPGENSGFVGKIAETDTRAFVNLNKLQTHTLIAGSTGSGKTVAAQDIVEEALLHNKSVILFDPTAQWTGFLRPCEDKSMLRRYKYFNMPTKKAQPFNGSIKTITDPYELIEIEKYLNKPGEITIFNVSSLKPKEIDIVVANTIEQVFGSNPVESQALKTLIVYDEVHRLLPKFGGSGEGFVQLERGAREFRKWGIGLVLISQVLSDFIGEIKANIGTEIQMGTRYEGDLDRISMKYGDDVLKSVVKEPAGTGMVVNAQYNAGRPYFTAFRPILHSTKRLGPEELANYEKYFSEMEDLEYQAEQLKLLEVDVLDLELEMKLARGKIKEGKFPMAEMYLETLRPKIEEQWKSLGKKPMHIVKKKITKAEVASGIAKAKKEREEIVKKGPGEEVSLAESILELKKLVEEKKKKGVKTADVEAKIVSLNDKVRMFKGKINDSDSKVLKDEVKLLRDQLK